MVKGYLFLFSPDDLTGKAVSAEAEIALGKFADKRNAIFRKKSSGGGCDLFLFGMNESAMEDNQAFRKDASSRYGHFWSGPMVDVLAKTSGIPFPDSDPIKMESVYTQGSDLNVYFRFSPEDGVLIVKTDLLNSGYVYSTQTKGGGLAFSSSSLLLAALTGASIDFLAATEFLATGSIYGQRSLYSDISLLKPSRFYVYDRNGGVETHEYWKPENILVDTLGLNDAVDSIIERLDSRFAQMDASRKKWVIDLTGGYDSRMNVAFALRKMKSFETIVYGSDTDDDVTISRTIADKLGFNHRVVSPIDFNREDIPSILREASMPTDYELDAVEYSRVYKVHKERYKDGESSMHGSTADVCRNVFMQPAVHLGSPYGQMDVTGMIDLKYPSLLNTEYDLAPNHRFNWHNHMRNELAVYDVQDHPCHLRADLIYLRVRMQFWQGRIGSSTNQIHTSLTPWTDMGVLNTILTTKYSEKQRGMISRLLLSRCYKGLSDFPIAKGKPSGVGLASEIKALPDYLRYVAYRVAVKLNMFGKEYSAKPEYFHCWEYLKKNAAQFEGFLDGTLIKRLLKGEDEPGAGHFALMCRLVTLSKARAALDSLR